MVTQGQQDDWFEFQSLTRTFIKVYADLSPDPAILDFTAEVKWACVRVFQRRGTTGAAATEHASPGPLPFTGENRVIERG